MKHKITNDLKEFVITSYVENKLSASQISK